MLVSDIMTGISLVFFSYAILYAVKLPSPVSRAASNPTKWFRERRHPEKV
jgi:hypothetical protein